MTLRGSHFGASWAPKSTQDRPKSPLKTTFFQKRRFSKKRAPCGPQHDFGPPGAPKTTQDRPKIAPRRLQDDLQELLFSSSFLSSILLRLGSDFDFNLAPLGHPKAAIRGFLRPLKLPKTTHDDQDGLKMPQDAPKTPQDSAKSRPRPPKVPPRPPSDAPKRPQIDPRHPQNNQKSTQDTNDKRQQHNITQHNNTTQDNTTHLYSTRLWGGATLLVSPSLPPALERHTGFWLHSFFPPLIAPQLQSKKHTSTQLNLTHFLTLRGLHFEASWPPKSTQDRHQVAS